MMERNADELFYSALQLLKHEGKLHDTRNGKALSIERPVLAGLLNPRHRVVFSPVRKANPYFHVMETVWMLAGAKSVHWLKDFNQNIASYAEEDGHINGAYGYRWRTHFDFDQIRGVIGKLHSDPNTRQAVIGMYDPDVDRWVHWKDRPCNTHLYFRIVDDKLDMTVCNRSNDVVWGMCGANVVHMTYLQELVALALGREPGRYYVLTNNLHIYEHHFHMLEEVGPPPNYYGSLKPTVMLWPDECFDDILADCVQFNKEQQSGSYSTNWVRRVVVPMYEHYMCRLNPDKPPYDTFETKAQDWARAERLWREWHDS